MGATAGLVSRKMVVSVEPLPEELRAAYIRHELAHGRKPKVTLTPTQKAKRDRARAKRKRRSKSR